MIKAKVNEKAENSKFGKENLKIAISIIESYGGYFIDFLEQTEKGLVIKNHLHIETAEADRAKFGAPVCPYWVIPHQIFNLFLQIHNLIPTGTEYAEFIADEANELHSICCEFLVLDTCFSSVVPSVVRPLINYKEL